MKPSGSLLGGASLLALCACAPEPGEPPAPPPPELRPVVSRAIAALEAELGIVELAREPVPAELALEIGEILRLTSDSQGTMRDLALGDLRGFDPQASWVLSDRVADAALPFDERAGTAAILGEMATRPACTALLERIETLPDKDLVAHCAHALGRADRDWVVPRLMLRLKYEVHHEAWIWIAEALVRLRIFTGLPGLQEVATSSYREDLRPQAASLLTRLADEHGFASSAEMARCWESGDPEGRLPAPEASRERELEIWRVIAALDDFQLRPVDDGRYVLSRLDGGASRLLARALSDESGYVRVHAAQALERMGPRAAPAGPDLVRALADPLLAPQAAEALGRVGYAPAEPELVARLAPSHHLGLRVAAARALGGLGLPSSTPALRPLVADEAEAIDLRAAAAASLLRTAPRDALEEAVRLLVSLLTSETTDPIPPEQALDAWLRGLPDELPGKAELLERWDALDRSTDRGPQDVELERARLEGRAELLSGALGQLLS